MSDPYLPGDARQRIQDLLEDRITQAGLAEKVGLSNSALSRYLQGSTKNLLAKRIFRTEKIMTLKRLRRNISWCCLH